MIRQKLIEKEIGSPADFRWRSHEISRIEGLSDAVFAFAVTLLVVSLEVPKTFNDLVQPFQILSSLWTAGQHYCMPQRSAAVCRVVLRLSAQVPVFLSCERV